VLERFLKKMREKVRSRDFVVTLHADEKINEDGLTVFDLERVLLTGDIVERQKDRETGELSRGGRSKTAEPWSRRS
jgi:hypothetical protein